MDYVTMAMNPMVWMLDLSCFNLGWDNEQKFYYEVLIMIGLPPAIICLNLILWTIGTLFTKCLADSENGYSINKGRL